MDSGQVQAPVALKTGRQTMQAKAMIWSYFCFDSIIQIFWSFFMIYLSLPPTFHKMRSILLLLQELCCIEYETFKACQLGSTAKVCK